MHSRGSSIAVIVFVLSVFCLQNNSEARRRGGIVFINFANETTCNMKKELTPDDFFFLTNTVDEKKDYSEDDLNGLKTELAGSTLAYKYTYFGLFWLEIWTWGGEAVILKDNLYYTLDIPQDQIVNKFGGKPFVYTFPPLLCGLLLLGGGWLGFVFNAKRLQQKGEESARMAAQQRAQRGGGILNQNNSTPATPAPLTMEQIQELYDNPIYQHALQLLEETQSFVKPIEYLVQNGVPESQAGFHLTALKKAIADASES